jgi:hypothetical protein
MDGRKDRDDKVDRYDEAISSFFEILQMCLNGDISGCCGTLKSQTICTNVEKNLLKQTEENKTAIIYIIRPKFIIYIYIYIYIYMYVQW